MSSSAMGSPSSGESPPLTSAPSRLVPASALPADRRAPRCGDRSSRVSIGGHHPYGGDHESTGCCRHGASERGALRRVVQGGRAERGHGHWWSGRRAAGHGRCRVRGSEQRGRRTGGDGARSRKLGQWAAPHILQRLSSIVCKFISARLPGRFGQITFQEGDVPPRKLGQWVVPHFSGDCLQACVMGSRTASWARSRWVAARTRIFTGRN